MVHIKSENIVMRSISELVPNPKNNNRHPLEQLERLAEIIKYQGFRDPIIVSNRSGFIVCGHARLEAARKLGMDKVPVIYQDFDSEAQEYAHLTADNEIARWSQLDRQAVHLEVKELELNINMLGIESFTVEKDVPECAEGPPKEKKEKTCPHCGESL